MIFMQHFTSNPSTKLPRFLVCDIDAFPEQFKVSFLHCLHNMFSLFESLKFLSDLPIGKLLDQSLSEFVSFLEPLALE